MQPPSFKAITNRSRDAGAHRFALPEDGFVQLAPLGTAPNMRGDDKRILQVVDRQALESMYNRAVAQGGEMLVDFEHFSHEADKPTDAAAWLPLDADHLQLRDDGLYGKPRWSEDGEAAVTGGRLRYISPEFPDDDAVLESLGGKKYRPLQLSGLGLTNRPGFRRHARPLTNSGRGDPAPEPTTTNMHKDILALALGLTVEELDKLDEPTLRQRAQELKDKAAGAETAAGELAAIKNREADAFMAQHDKVIPKNPAVRTHLRETFLKNRDLADGLVAGYREDDDGMTDAERERAGRKPLHNRDTAKAPADAGEAKEARLANKRSTRANQMLVNREHHTWSAAWEAACAEIPE